MQRRLTTIIAADVAGYSRLIGLDEEGTLAALRLHRAELIDPLLEQHGGRIANTAGDSLLIEFPSAVEAVRCAMAVQEGIAGRNADVPDDRRIEIRVGINVGDVIDQDGDLLGDGVNIAARLEAQAPPGGIVLSRAVRDQIRDRLDVNLADLGEIEVKNIARPVRAFQVAGEGVAPIAPPLSGSNNSRRHWALALVAVVALIAGLAWWQLQKPDFARADPAKMIYSLPDEPSIAVLAFKKLTGDTEQEHFSDGISEDIIAALSHLPGVLVIARNSAFSYKGKDVDVRQIAEEMSVRYVLEGSLYQSGDSLRITAQLIDAVSGHLIWSEKYDRPRADFFKVRDEITFGIVQQLNIELIEEKAFWNQVNSTTNSEVWLLIAKSRSHQRRANKVDNQIALDLAYQALAIDANSILVNSQIAWRTATAVFRGWTDEPEAALQTATQFAEKVIELDESAPDGYAAMATVRFVQRRIKEAIEYGEMAVARAPGDAGALSLIAIYYQKDMQADRAIEMFERAVRINRSAAPWVWENYGESLIMAGRHEEAVPVYFEALKSAKGYFLTEVHLGLAIAYDALGQLDKVPAEIEAALENSPDLTIVRLREFQRYKDQEYKDRWLATLARLGVPEA